MSGISSVVGASVPTAMPRPAKVYFRFEFIPHGSNVPVDTIPITSTTAEASAKQVAWEKFAKKNNISIEEAKQQYALRRKLS